ncbi:hypothetical protein HBN50_00560 [Halobacteriovorax sp. GB3]|uniref:hypothetical protein n=1 Tax=Halobacteriovorax sp. GB3 TaxID=2719615 RepID=UPI00235F7110|nr:hypothetical protein [Halobacteriovorax sp. GB3]MDD0851557.1 hypothetical protein [Halobacteriovorax sp. GB3]
MSNESSKTTTTEVEKLGPKLSFTGNRTVRKKLSLRPSRSLFKVKSVRPKTSALGLLKKN